MTVPIKTIGMAMAASAAGFFSAAAITFADENQEEEAKVHCYGVNICTGHNDCKTEENACRGQATCMGKGFVDMSAAACAEADGEVEASGEAK